MAGYKESGVVVQRFSCVSFNPVPLGKQICTRADLVPFSYADSPTELFAQKHLYSKERLHLLPYGAIANQRA